MYLNGMKVGMNLKERTPWNVGTWEVITGHFNCIPTVKKVIFPGPAASYREKITVFLGIVVPNITVTSAVPVPQN
jgi:hypothetical protein